MAARAVLVQHVWRSAFDQLQPRTDAERALWNHLLSVAQTNEHTEALLQRRLERELRAKRIYCTSSWGYFEAANVVARVDECIIALQEQKKRAFLEPLAWDLVPHAAILATAEAVLLLFDVATASDALTTWRTAWSLWIVKNIDAHTSGWEWVATNEPIGLFTKPYVLSSTHLERIEQLVDEAARTPATHPCWQRLRAYACLRDWVAACTQYVHMRHHCLEGFPAYSDVQKLVTPPQRAPQTNVWFRLESAGCAYYYNRLLQSVTLEQPLDFDGAGITNVPSVIHELVADALERDVATRLELEKRSRQRERAKLLAEEEWLQCFDVHADRTYYYSLTNYRVAYSPPESGVYILAKESVAFAAVLRLQAAYRRRRLDKKLQVKRTKRASLPVFSAFSRDTKTSKFYQ